MKFRFGFVSNSSSSSFLCLMTDNVYNLVVNDLSELAKILFKYLVDKNEFAKTTCYKFHYIYGSYEYFTDEEIELVERYLKKNSDDSDSYEVLDSILYEIKSAISKLKTKNQTELFIHREEF